MDDGGGVWQLWQCRECARVACVAGWWRWTVREMGAWNILQTGLQTARPVLQLSVVYLVAMALALLHRLNKVREPREKRVGERKARRLHEREERWWQRSLLWRRGRRGKHTRRSDLGGGSVK